MKHPKTIVSPGEEYLTFGLIIKKILFWIAFAFMTILSLEFLSIIILSWLVPNENISWITIFVMIVPCGLCIWGSIACILHIFKKRKEPQKKVKMKLSTKVALLILACVILIINLYRSIPIIIESIPMVGKEISISAFSFTFLVNIMGLYLLGLCLFKLFKISAKK